MKCDLETGICGISEDNSMDIINFNQIEKKVTLYYFTDPICSHCWALEPNLNRFIQQYSSYFNVKVVMGGLLQSWNGFADRANGIQAPADVTLHWKEVGLHGRMPIDGSLWQTNPIQSSYPPSRVFKIIQAIDEEKANLFLRKAREALFVWNKNIAQEQTLLEISNDVGLDGLSILEKSNSDEGQQLLEQDFDLASSFGVRGFPTIILVNEENQGVKIVGAQPVQAYVEALKKVMSKEPNPTSTPKLSKWLQDGTHIFSKEIEIMYDVTKEEVIPFIQRELTAEEYTIHEIMDEAYIIKR